MQATIGTQLIYDDDVRFDVEEDAEGNIIDSGVPRVQFRQLLSIGLAYNF
jgi:hypothetical protein